MKVFTRMEVCQRVGIKPERVEFYIEQEWIKPREESNLDEEDEARIRLIEELERDFGVNDESVPLILHLLDQIHYFRAQLDRLSTMQRKTGST